MRRDANWLDDPRQRQTGTLIFFQFRKLCSLSTNPYLIVNWVGIVVAGTYGVYVPKCTLDLAVPSVLGGAILGGGESAITST